jgi:Flp pilus assembly protein TadD
MQFPLLTMPVIAFALIGCQSVSDKPSPQFSLASLFRTERPVEQNDPVSLAEEHFVRGDYALAERHYREAVELNAGDVRSWFGLAASYDQLKRFDLADRAYDQVLQLSGRSPQYLNNLGYSYHLRGDPRRATALLREARSLDPIDPVIANNVIVARTGRAPF